MKTIKIATDTLLFEVSTHGEYGNLHLSIMDPFEKTVAEMISPQDIEKLIRGLQEALETHKQEE